MSSFKKILRANFDTIIVVLIAICIIGMINASNYKIEEIFQSHRESLLVRDINGEDISEEFAEQLYAFRPDTCKMIEIYSADFQLRLRMQFAEKHEHIDSFDDFPELKALLLAHEEGHTTIRTADEEEDVYFRWTKTVDSGELCLTIVYMSRPIVKNLWIIPFLGYMVLILTFIMLIRIRLIEHNDRIKQYDELAKEIQGKLIH